MTYLKRSVFKSTSFSYRWWHQRSCAFPGSGWGGAKPVGSSQWSSPAPCYAFGCRSQSRSASSSDSDRGSLSLAPCGWHTAPIWSENIQVYQDLDEHHSSGKKNVLEIFQLINSSVPEVVVKLQVGGRWCGLAHGTDNVGAEERERNRTCSVKVEGMRWSYSESPILSWKVKVRHLKKNIYSTDQCW